jgi:uridine kinase
MSFARAQARWEESWIHGPPDDPLESYYDEIAGWDIDQLEEELKVIRHSQRHPEPEDNTVILDRMETAIQVAIDTLTGNSDEG